MIKKSYYNFVEKYRRNENQRKPKTTKLQMLQARGLIQPVHGRFLKAANR